jgi:hypothetical protein
VTLLCVFGPTDPLLGSRFWNWVAAMLVATPLSFFLTLVLCLVDVALIKRRAIPIGARAFVLSAIAPILVGIAWEIHPPGQHGEALPFALATIVPIVVVAFSTRFILGKRR